MLMLEGMPYSYDEDDLAESLATHMKQHPLISYRIDTLTGSAGGWPEITFFAPNHTAMRDFCTGVYSSGDYSQDVWLAEQAVEVQ